MSCISVLPCQPESFQMQVTENLIYRGLKNRELFLSYNKKSRNVGVAVASVQQLRSVKESVSTMFLAFSQWSWDGCG